MLEDLELAVMASPAGRARHEEDRRSGVQRQVPIASELLVDDEAVAVQRPAGAGIQHATGKAGLRRTRSAARSASVAPVAVIERAPIEQARYAEKLDRDGGWQGGRVAG